MSEDEKTEIYHQYKKIVYYIANRLRYLDTELDDIVGWGFVGFVVAINQYEKLLEEAKNNKAEDKGGQEAKSILRFDQIAFQVVRQEILDQYRRRPAEKSEFSIDAPYGVDGSDWSIGDTLVDQSRLGFSEKDILSLLKKALEKETTINRNITIDFFISGKSVSDISKEIKKATAYITRTARRGQAIIKKYLEDHDIIVENIESTPEPDKRATVKINAYRMISNDDYGKIKYIRKEYPYLSANDIALLLQVSPYSVSDLFYFPTIGYRKSGLDDSIEEEVSAYASSKYPAHVPSEVIVMQARELQEVI